MKYKKRNCEECGKEFIPKGKNQYGIQKYCSKKCKKKNENRKYYEKKSKGTLNNSIATLKSIPKYKDAKTDKKSLRQEVNNIQQHLYPVKNGTNIVKKLEKIHEDLVKYMNILKLDTYPEEVKNHCIYIMKESIRFLEDQLKLERDKGVIIVKSEETS